MKRICKKCGSGFNTLPCIVKKGWGNACSRKCQYALMSNKKTKNCLTCNKEFLARNVDVKKGNRGKYCSRQCFIKDPIKRKQEKKCFVCKKIVLRNPSNIKIGKRYFCSKKCNAKALVKEIEVSCQKCKKIYMVNPSQKSKNNYCSMKCRRLEMGKCTFCKENKIVRSSGLCKKCHTANDNTVRNYGITLPEAKKYKENGCMTCGSKDRLFIDHNHKTNKFRGILCPNCNFLLGAAKDSTIILNKAIKYLTR